MTASRITADSHS